VTGFRYITRGREGCGGCQGELTEELHLKRADADTSAWDGPAAMSACSKSDTPSSCFSAICAGKRAGDASTQEAWALPHHKHPGDAPNASGVANALSRLPQTQGLTNASAARSHLEAHMKAINPDYQANAGSVAAMRSAAYGVHGTRGAGVIPSGKSRMHAFPTKLRHQVVTIDGQKYLEFEGYASTFGQGYEMWDMFGKYTEEVDHDAFRLSLDAGPDTAFLINHKGVTMARTTATIGRDGTPSLRIYDDDTGLGVHGFANLNRQDVRDLASALDDELITEMSFAFMLNDGWWSKDYDVFRITEADINRGDVSAVNYGANPFTTITARAPELLEDLRRMPAPVQREAFRIVRSVGEVRRQLRQDTDSDDDPNALATALDAALDEACSLVQGVDMTALPEPVAQALGIMVAAETTADELMEALGLYDADDAGTGEKGAPPKPTRAVPVCTGRSVNLARARLLG
jgi:HK97 family phage prohead protease